MRRPSVIWRLVTGLSLVSVVAVGCNSNSNLRAAWLARVHSTLDLSPSFVAYQCDPPTQPFFPFNPVAVPHQHADAACSQINGAQVPFGNAGVWFQAFRRIHINDRMQCGTQIPGATECDMAGVRECRDAPKRDGQLLECGDPSRLTGPGGCVVCLPLTLTAEVTP
jgi:hypothetical protein